MPRDEDNLLDILTAAKWACAHIAGMTREMFLADVKTQDSVIRRLEIIGEAAGRIPESSRLKLPTVPWQSMIRMRNFLIHEYDDVDPAIVWDTIKNDLPPLISALAPMVPGDT
jgi:uncharacterized protein with HEPN domain